MDKIVYSLVYNRKRSLNKRGTALVQIEAYQGKKKKYFSTRVYLRPEQWDNRRSVVKNHPNSEALNWWLHECIAHIEKVELELWQQGKPISLELIKEMLRRREDSRSFTAFYREEVQMSALKESSRKNHLTTLNLLTDFKSDIRFSELTFEFLCSFEHYLRQKGYHINTIAKHMKHLKRYVNAAINKDYMDERLYAFRKYKIKTVEYKHTHLTPEELGLLERLRLAQGLQRQRKTLDAFLFCCYAGLRYSDFTRLKPDNLIHVQDEIWLAYKSEKTGIEIHLPLYLLFGGKAVTILRDYQDDLASFFLLKDNSNINKDLRNIARQAGLAKRISFHTARHTNATLLIYSGVNITTVQKLLGHKSVKTTEIYANVMDQTIVHDLEQHRVQTSGNKGRGSKRKI